MKDMSLGSTFFAILTQVSVPHTSELRIGLNMAILNPRDDSGYGLTGYGGYGFVTSHTILTVYYCNRSNLALFNRY